MQRMRRAQSNYPSFALRFAWNVVREHSVCIWKQSNLLQRFRLMSAFAFAVTVSVAFASLNPFHRIKFPNENEPLNLFTLRCDSDIN